MKFKTEDLIELACGGTVEGFTVHRNELIDNSRWSVIYDFIFEYEGKYYKTDYERGATEYQDTQPFENEGEEVECKEVKRVEKVVYDYVEV